MSVFRVHKNQNYTVMSNYHLKDKNISLKAKGLLSVILALPDNWNYSIRGLSSILMEGVTAVSNILNELEAAGYIERNLLRDESGKIADTEYAIYEQPVNAPEETIEITENTAFSEVPQTEKPQTYFPCLGYQDTACTDTDDSMQLNTNKLNTKINNLSIKPQTENGLMDGMHMESKDIREQLAENIDYVSLVIDDPDNKELVDECLSLMADVIEGEEDKVRIGGRNISYPVVKKRFMELTKEHMQYVLESLEKTTCAIKNIRSYLLTVLYNAATTMRTYYRQRVNHDMSAGKLSQRSYDFDQLERQLLANNAGFQLKGVVP